MEPIKCFLITPLERATVYLQRYTNAKGWTCSEGYHDALNYIGDMADPIDRKRGCYTVPNGDRHDHNDPRWPKACKCGYEFTPEDNWQFFTDDLWHDTEGKVYTLRSSQSQFHQAGVLPVPAGAMWDAWWYPNKGPDGLYLVVMTPGGIEWYIDSRASNCTMPQDDTHRCWVRHGIAPEITVDKNGHTCQTGAGSIQTSKWHGFLEDGYLTETRKRW